MDDSDNPHGYGAAIWQRFRAPARAGHFPASTPGLICVRAGTPAARAVLELSLQMAGDRVLDARFRAYGCPTTIAVGAWLAEAASGRSAAELARIDAAQIRAALEIPEDRAHCALLGEDTLRAVLARFQEHSA